MDKILRTELYEVGFDALSISGNEVYVFGERTIELEDGRIIEQYLYNIKGYKCENGKPFASLKANIFS